MRTSKLLRASPLTHISLRSTLAVALLVFFATIGSGSSYAQEVEDLVPGEEEIIPKVDLQDAKLSRIIRWVAHEAKMSVVIEGIIDKTITVHLLNKPAGEIIESIAKNNGLVIERNSGTMHVKMAAGNSFTENRLVLSIIPTTKNKQNFDIDFENVEVRTAIMAIAREARLNVAIEPELIVQKGQNESLSEETSSLSEQEQFVEEKTKKKISYHKTNTNPLQAINDIALSSGFKVVESSEEGGKIFKIRLMAPTEGFEMVARKGIPEPFLSNLAKEVEKFLTSDGSVAGASELQTLTVRDRKDNIDNVITPLLNANLKDLDDQIKRYEQEEAEKARAAQSSEELAPEDTEIRIYTLQRDLDDQDVQAGLEKILSDKGEITVNPEANKVIVIDHKDRFQLIDKFMENYDANLQQVQIHATIAEISLQENDSHGLEVFNNLAAAGLNDGTFSFLNTNGGLGAFALPTGTIPSEMIFQNDHVRYAFDFLSTNNRIHNRSTPSVVCADGEEAEILVGQKIPFLKNASTSGGVTQGTVEFEDVAMKLTIKPRIFDNGSVYLAITVEITEQIGSVDIEGNPTPILSNRSVNSSVTISDGKTLVIGDLIADRERTIKRGIPILSDIPGINLLFSAENFQTEQTDLLVFIRPTIVGKNGEDFASVKDSRRSVLIRDMRPIVNDKSRILSEIPGLKTKDLNDGSSLSPFLERRSAIRNEENNISVPVE